MNKPLPLSYKGERNYLQGGDIFNALSDVASELAGDRGAYVERIAFRSFARMACEVFTEPPSEQLHVIGQANLAVPGKSGVNVWLVETTDLVTSRRPFDEAQLLANASFSPDGRSVILPERSVYTPIEDVIALTKKLSYAVSPEVNGKWVFGQLDLTEPFTVNYRKLEIRLKNLIGGRFSVNNILLDDRNIGAIRFIVGAP